MRQCGIVMHHSTVETEVMSDSHWPAHTEASCRRYHISRLEAISVLTTHQNTHFRT